MPREVATAMLSEPRAKLTNRMRKNCIAARYKVFASSSPFRRMPGSEDGEIVKSYGYSEIEPRAPEERMQRRFATATLRQLSNWLRRSIARRVVVQRRYLAVVGDTMLAQAQRNALAGIAERLDTVRDVCESEITMRANKCNSVVAIRRPFRSAVDFCKRSE